MTALIGVPSMAGDFRVGSCRKLLGTCVKVGAKSGSEIIQVKSNFSIPLEKRVRNE